MTNVVDRMKDRTSFLAVGALAFGLAAGSCGPSRQPMPDAGPAPATTGAAGEEAEEARGSLPPVPRVTGPLALDLVYPAEGAALTARDSNFVFGNTGNGDTRLTINGAPVTVAPNGAFLAFLPVPPDGVYQVAGSLNGQTATLTRRIRVPAAAPSVPAEGVTIVPGSAGTRMLTVRQGEPVAVRFRGTPGGQARIVFPDGSSVPLAEQRVTERDEGFMQDRARTPREFTEYAGSFSAATALRARDSQLAATTLVAPASPRGSTAFLELVRGRDTVRTPLELSLGVLAPGQTRVAVAAGERPDGTVIGTAVAGSGTPYHWRFPNGTRFAVIGEQGGQYRVRLTDDQTLWIDARSLRLLPEGTPAPSGAVGAVRIEPTRDWVDVRLSLSDRLPFFVRVDEDRMIIEVYGAESRTNWLYYGTEDPLVRRAEWEQPADDRYTVTLDLAGPVWGWRSFWDESGALVVRVRRPPAIEERRPLAGLLVAVDAGHPPGGAIGPTRLTEAEANLAISRRLVRMLEEAGARVLQTRPDTSAVDLNLRPVLAERADAHLLVSVHNNAFPDGVNPFENNGTTVFYNAPQSLELARAMQRRLVHALGLRDLGIAHADLALVRTTWMPSVLTESMFLMVPEQEAALRSADVHERIARAHFRAIQDFLREWENASDRR